MSTQTLRPVFSAPVERLEELEAEYTNAFNAFLLAKNKTEIAYTFGKLFRFREGKLRTLPRDQRYPKRLARFMDRLDKAKIPFCVECLSSTSSPKARLLFKG